MTLHLGGLCSTQWPSFFSFFPCCFFVFLNHIFLPIGSFTVIHTAASLWLHEVINIFLFRAGRYF